MWIISQSNFEGQFRLFFTVAWDAMVAVRGQFPERRARNLGAALAPMDRAAGKARP